MYKKKIFFSSFCPWVVLIYSCIMFVAHCFVPCVSEFRSYKMFLYLLDIIGKQSFDLIILQKNETPYKHKIII